MRLMEWDVDVIHRPGTDLVDIDYWSCLGVDLQFDPLYAKYLVQTRQYRKLHPPVTTVPMLPENMPYYRGPKVKLPSSDAPQGSALASAEVHYVNTLLSDMTLHCPTLVSPLSIRLIQFGDFKKVLSAPTDATVTRYNAEFAAYALQTVGFA